MARRRRGPRPPEVQPFDVDGVRTVALGTVAWAVAFVVLALNRDKLEAAGHGWWLWTCLAGVGLGLLGLEYCRKRRDAISRARRAAAAEVDTAVDTAVDTEIDTEIDTAVDTAVDTETDAAVDAAVDTAIDTAVDPKPAPSSYKPRRARR